MTFWAGGLPFGQTVTLPRAVVLRPDLTFGVGHGIDVSQGGSGGRFARRGSSRRFMYRRTSITAIAPAMAPAMIQVVGLIARSPVTTTAAEIDAKRSSVSNAMRHPNTSSQTATRANPTIVVRHWLIPRL